MTTAAREARASALISRVRRQSLLKIDKAEYFRKLDKTVRLISRRNETVVVSNDDGEPVMYSDGTEYFLVD